MDNGSVRPVSVPDALVESVTSFFGPEWARRLPALAVGRLDEWGLTVAGESMHGAVALVVPVRRADGTSAVLKIQPQDPETEGEPLALRAWNGDGAVRLFDHDPRTGAMLLEALDAGRRLDDEPLEPALEVIGSLLARLTAHPGPEGLRGLGPLTEVAGLDRERARAWTRVRLLQDCLWLEDARHRVPPRARPHRPGAGRLRGGAGDFDARGRGPERAPMSLSVGFRHLSHPFAERSRCPLPARPSTPNCCPPWPGSTPRCLRASSRSRSTRCAPAPSIWHPGRRPT